MSQPEAEVLSLGYQLEELRATKSVLDTKWREQIEDKHVVVDLHDTRERIQNYMWAVEFGR